MGGGAVRTAALSGWGVAGVDENATATREVDERGEALRDVVEMNAERVVGMRNRRVRCRRVRRGRARRSRRTRWRRGRLSSRSPAGQGEPREEQAEAREHEREDTEPETVSTYTSFSASHSPLSSPDALYRAGRRTSKHAPLRGESEAASGGAVRAIVPPCAAAMRLARANPSPVPPWRPVTRGSKIRAAIAGGTPGPSSSTWMIVQSPSTCALVVTVGTRGWLAPIAFS